VQAVKDVRERGRTCILDIEMEVSLFFFGGWRGGRVGLVIWGWAGCAVYLLGKGIDLLLTFVIYHRASSK
jgi:hypothetical protein